MRINRVWVLSLVTDNGDAWDYFEQTQAIAVFNEKPSEAAIVDYLSIYLPTFDIDKLTKLANGKNVEFGKHNCYEIRLEEVDYV